MSHGSNLRTEQDRISLIETTAKAVHQEKASRVYTLRRTPSFREGPAGSFTVTCASRGLLRGVSDNGETRPGCPSRSRQPKLLHPGESPPAPDDGAHLADRMSAFQPEFGTRLIGRFEAGPRPPDWSATRPVGPNGKDLHGLMASERGPAGTHATPSESKPS